MWRTRDLFEIGEVSMAAANYIVRVQYDVRDAGQVFGPFEDRGTAEECVIALAAVSGR